MDDLTAGEPSVVVCRNGKSGFGGASKECARRTARASEEGIE